MSSTFGDELYLATPAAIRPRLDSVDLLRGLGMVIMALDPTSARRPSSEYQ
jgi:uncharacterized membrane protein